MNIDLEAASRLADDAERLNGTQVSYGGGPFGSDGSAEQKVPDLIAAVRGLVERVRELERECHLFGSLLNQTDGMVLLPNGREVYSMMDFDAERVTWHITADDASFESAAEAVRAATKSEESTNA